MKRAKEPPKQRNPYVQHLISKKQGAHTKTKKSTRRQDKIKLKKEYFAEISYLYYFRKILFLV